MDSVVSVDETDLARMKEICTALHITKGVHIEFKGKPLNLYGFTDHLAVYLECVRLVPMAEKERNAVIEAMNTYKLRDIQTKIKSAGQVGKYAEMVQGMKHKMKEMKEWVDRQRMGKRKRSRAEMSNQESPRDSKMRKC